MSAANAASAVAVQAGMPGSPASIWILSRLRDFLLFIGTPYIILPVVILAERFWNASQLYLVVAAFGALGHHLPGMMRAYGDRDLFERFKLRFILGPIVLVGTCFGFAVLDRDMHAITLIAYGWGIWHGLMQVHGFLRIYDAKVKSFARLTARLDQSMCMAWFGAGVLFSASRTHFLLEAFYMSGGPQVPFVWVEGLRAVWGALTVVVTLAYVANVVACARRGTPQNPVKLFGLVTSLAFWMYCCLVVKNLLVGILMFELFHDVQYLTIVWLFNRKRALTAPARVGSATRALFGQGQARAVFYVGLVMAYGSLYFLEMAFKHWKPVESAADTPVWGGILAASGLLHFYYDGFIWKVKERPTRMLLGLEGGREVVQAAGKWWNRSWRRIPAWAEHGINWMPFAAAIGLFVYTHANPAMPENTARIVLGQSFPRFDLAQSNLGMALYADGDLDGAIEANRHALLLVSSDEDLRAQTTNNLGWALIERAEAELKAGQAGQARSRASEAFALDATFLDALSNKATDTLRAGKADDAITKYRVALLMDPEHPGVRMNLALALGATGHLDEALAVARAAQANAPNDPKIARLVARLESARAESGPGPRPR